MTTIPESGDKYGEDGAAAAACGSGSQLTPLYVGWIIVKTYSSSYCLTGSDDEGAPHPPAVYLCLI